jgi:hypothetical protein
MESGLGWLSALRMPHILSGVPRARRAILDADGMYNDLILLDGYDRNHTDEGQRAQWLEYYGILADRVFQPESSPPKTFDLLSVGHNWWRWREVSTRLLPAVERIRTHLDGICFMGSWWDEPPVVDDSLAPAFRSDPQWFERLRIQVKPAVPYTEVIAAMCSIFTADTIPLVMLNPDHAESVYGPAGRELALFEDVDQKLLDVLQRPGKYQEIVAAVRGHLVTHHSYPVRVQQLVSALKDAGN